MPHYILGITGEKELIWITKKDFVKLFSYSKGLWCGPVACVMLPFNN